MNRKSTLTPITVGATILWAALTVFSVLAPGNSGAKLAAFAAIAALVIFCFAHSTRRLGVQRAAIMFLIAVVIANIYENLSITTGFPFGSYVHTDASGPRLFLVPLIVGPIFYSVCYIAWSLAIMVLGEPSGSRDTLRLVGTPIIATFIVVGWNICSDPVGATIGRQWIWEHSGAYFGVPLSNYIGWFLCTWTILQGWNLYLARTGPSHPVGLCYWYEASAFWGLLALQYPLLLAASPPTQVIEDTGGWAWRSGDILQAAALMSFYTMIMAAVTGALAVTQRYRTA